MGKYFRGKCVYHIRKMHIYFYSKYSTFIMHLRLYFWGVTYGKGAVFFGFSKYIRFPGSIMTFGNNCRFRSDRLFSNLAGISCGCVFSTLNKEASIKIGNNCGFSGCSVSADYRITIEDDVLVGANVKIFDHDFHTNVAKAVKIQKGAWIGMNCVVLKGVTIGENSIIGANSVVTKDVPPNTVAAGNPCKVVKSININ